MPHRGRRPTESDVAIAPIQLSFPLPNDPSVRILLHLTVLSTSIVLFLTTSSVEAPSSNCSLGSFVYAMPNVNTLPPLSFRPLLIPISAHPNLDTPSKHAAIHADRDSRFCNSNGEDIGAEDGEADVRG